MMLLLYVQSTTPMTFTPPRPAKEESKCLAAAQFMRVPCLYKVWPISGSKVAFDDTGLLSWGPKVGCGSPQDIPSVLLVAICCLSVPPIACTASQCISYTSRIASPAAEACELYTAWEQAVSKWPTEESRGQRCLLEHWACSGIERSSVRLFRSGHRSCLCAACLHEHGVASKPFPALLPGLFYLFSSNALLTPPGRPLTRVQRCFAACTLQKLRETTCSISHGCHRRIGCPRLCNSSRDPEPDAASPP